MDAGTVPAGRVVMGRTRCEYCGGDVESAGIGGTICNADRGPNDEGPSRMDVAAAADAVLEFEPKVVYPYHYRGPDGLSDVDQFAAIVGRGNPTIEVVLLDWYKEE